MEKRRVVVFLFPILLILFFFVAHRFFFTMTQTTEQAASYFLYPFIVAQRIVVTPIFNSLEKRKSEKELKVLLNEKQQKIEKMQAKYIALQAEQDYEQDIEEIVAFKKRYDTTDAILAQVQVRKLADDEHFFIVNKGSTSGIHVDMVAVYKNNLLGKIVEVRPWYSRVRLITDTHCKVGSYCAGTQIVGIHEGINNVAESRLRYVSHLEPVKEGMIVLSSGEGMIFPRGFALGQIIAYTTDELQHDITLKPLVDMHSINYCFLIGKDSLS